MIISITTPVADNCEIFAESLPQNSLDSACLQTIQVQPQQHGWRLDRFLVAELAGFSRHYLQQLIADQAVVLEGSGVICKAATKVKFGQSWQIEIRPTPQSQAFVAQEIAIDVVYADADILVINKPAGMVVHPAPGNWSGTLLNALLWAYPELMDLPRAGIVHRLDKDTSGLMVVARHRFAMDGLTKMIAAREVSRQYLAAVHGAWRGADSQVVEQAIGRDQRNRVKMALVDLSYQNGKAAKSTFRLLRSSGNKSLIHCSLHTGRTHQIRLHSGYLGHPLLADQLYGGKVNDLIDRQALHAWRLAFAQPISGEMLCFYASPPDDWEKILKFFEISEQNILNTLKYNKV